MVVCDWRLLLEAWSTWRRFYTSTPFKLIPATIAYVLCA
ncbi:hypothetical protein CASFOL_018605 [Castilleja foliolosa]|uniref:Uncharacterized protein n=1 Tax=Castilleja foliolosa TaxID=1961234 RepID=A0ABD3D621_9LAMI